RAAHPLSRPSPLGPQRRPAVLRLFYLPCIRPNRLAERHHTDAGRERRGPDFERIVNSKVARRRLLRHSREVAARVYLRTDCAARTRVRLMRARLVETGQPRSKRAPESERKSGCTRRLQIRVFAIDHRMPQARL